MTNIIRINKKMQHLWRGCIKHNFIEHIIFTISHCTKACIFIIIIVVVVRLGRRRRIPPFKPRMSCYKDQLLRLLNTIP
ncbi:hypothetical protein Hanom_Chr03g00268801 [Helianthus anomalus]